MMQKQLETIDDAMTMAMNEYKPDDSITRRDTDEMHALKHAVFDHLTTAERNALIVYAEVGSYTKLGRVIGVGRVTAFYEIHRIQDKIKQYMKTKGYVYK